MAPRQLRPKVSLLCLEGQLGERAREIKDALDCSRAGDQPQLTAARSAQIVGSECHVNPARVHGRQTAQVEHDRAVAEYEARDRVFHDRSAGEIQFALQPQRAHAVADDSLQA
jgi:hypothetical protein